MKPTQRQIQFLKEIITELETLQVTNDITSPTHDTDLKERAEQICDNYIANDGGFSQGVLEDIFIDLLSLISNVQ